MRTRLTPLDGSFLRVETPNAHMHVAWLGIFEPPPGRPRPSLEAVRDSVAARLQHAPRFRQRLAFPLPSLGEPYWVDCRDFHVADHVVAVAAPDEPVSESRLRALTDAALSIPLDRRRPLWQIALVPRLEDGRLGVICKIHHALVDGKSAVELSLLLLNISADADADEAEPWSPRPAPGRARLGLESLVDGAGETLRAARAIGRLAASPQRGAGRVADTLRSAAMAVEHDLLTAAPTSYLNVGIGPDRTLLCHRAPIDRLIEVKRAAGVTLNDVCVAAVAGALRELARARGDEPRAMKVMVPVSVRADEERSSLGNRISFAFIELPVHLRSPRARLQRVHEQTAEFKRTGRPAGTELMLNALGALPGPLKDRAARAAASPRVYNLTVSNIPGPRFPVYLLGAEMVDAYPVVPMPEEHSLSIGVFTYREHACFGFYADPKALPEVHRLPAALSRALAWLARVTSGTDRSLRPVPHANGGTAGPDPTRPMGETPGVEFSTPV